MERKLNILRTPQVMHRLPSQNNFQIEDENVIQTIENFISILEANISEDNLILFHNNISTLEVEVENSLRRYLTHLIKDGAPTGSYHTVRNKIYTLPLKNTTLLSNIIGVSEEDYEAILFHELLHLSGTLLGYHKGINFSGFSQRPRSEIGVGMAIDDGYTERLLHRIFKVSMKYIKYKYEYQVAGITERIVGRNRMTTEYFNADLYGLIERLERYSSISKVENFITAADILYQISYGDIDYNNNTDLLYYHNYIANFLIEAYQNKLDESLNKGLITMTDHEQRLNRCILTLDSAYISLAGHKTRSRRR